MSISYIGSRSSGLSAVVNGKSYTVAAGHPSLDELFKAIADRKTDDQIEALFNAANAVKSYSGDRIVVQDGVLLYDGEEIHNQVVDRILEFMGDGLPAEPLINFLKRLLANPSKRSIEELYKFLEHKHLPITEDGCFLAYKGLRADYTDVNTGKFNNRPGQTLEMPRNKVDDNFQNGCSYGFHAGSSEYATGFSQGQTVIVKIDPANVVSVPQDCSFQKLRTCKYTVLSDYVGPLTKSLYEPDGSDYEPELPEVEEADYHSEYDRGYEVGQRDESFGFPIQQLTSEGNDTPEDGFAEGYADGVADKKAGLA